MNRRDFLRAASLMVTAALVQTIPDVVKALPVEKADLAVGFFDQFGNCLAIGCAKFKHAKNGTINTEPLSCVAINTGVISEIRTYNKNKEIFRGRVGCFESGADITFDSTYVKKGYYITTNTIEITNYVPAAASAYVTVPPESVMALV